MDDREQGVVTNEILCSPAQCRADSRNRFMLHGRIGVISPWK